MYKIVRKHNGNPVFGCNKCGFVTMREVAIKQHILNVHKPSKASAKVSTDNGALTRDVITAPVKKSMEESDG